MANALARTPSGRFDHQHRWIRSLPNAPGACTAELPGGRSCGRDAAVVCACGKGRCAEHEESKGDEK